RPIAVDLRDLAPHRPILPQITETGLSPESNHWRVPPQPGAVDMVDRSRVRKSLFSLGAILFALVAVVRGKHPPLSASLSDTLGFPKGEFPVSITVRSRLRPSAHRLLGGSLLLGAAITVAACGSSATTGSGSGSSPSAGSTASAGTSSSSAVSLSTKSVAGVGTVLV